MGPSTSQHNNCGKLTLDLSATDTFVHASETASRSYTKPRPSASTSTPSNLSLSSHHSPIPSPHGKRPHRSYRYSAISLKPPPLLIDRDKKPFSPPQARNPICSLPSTPDTHKDLPLLPSDAFRPSAQNQRSAWSKSSKSSESSLRSPDPKQFKSHHSGSSFKKITRLLSDLVWDTSRISKFQATKLKMPAEMYKANGSSSDLRYSNTDNNEKELPQPYDSDHSEYLSDVDLDKSDRGPMNDATGNPYYTPDGKPSTGHYAESNLQSPKIYDIGIADRRHQGTIDRDRDLERSEKIDSDTSMPPMMTPQLPAAVAPSQHDYPVHMNPTNAIDVQNYEIKPGEKSKVSSLHTFDAVPRQPKPTLMNYVNDLYSSETNKKRRNYENHPGCPHCQHRLIDNQSDFDEWWNEFKKKGIMPMLCKVGGAILLFFKIILFPLAWPFKSRTLKKVRQLIQFITYFPMMLYTTLIQIFIFLLLVLTIFLVICFWKLITDPVGWIQGKALYLGHEGYCKIRYKFNELKVLPDLPDADPPYGCPTPDPPTSIQKRAWQTHSEMAIAAYDTALATVATPSATDSALSGFSSSTATERPVVFDRRQYATPSTRSTNHATSSSLNLSKSTMVRPSSSSKSIGSSSSFSSSSSFPEPTSKATSSEGVESSSSDQQAITTVHETITATDTTTIFETVLASTLEESSTSSVMLVKFTLDPSQSTSTSGLVTTTSSAAANRRVELRWGRNSVLQEDKLKKRRRVQTMSSRSDGEIEMVPSSELSTETISVEDLDNVSDADQDREQRQVRSRRFDLPADTEAKTTSQGQVMPTSTSFTYPATLDQVRVLTTTFATSEMRRGLVGVVSAVGSALKSGEERANSEAASIADSGQSIMNSVQSSVGSQIQSAASSLQSEVKSRASDVKDEVTKLGDEVMDGLDGLWDKILKNILRLFAKVFAIIPTDYSKCDGCTRVGNASTSATPSKRAILVDLKAEVLNAPRSVHVTTTTPLSHIDATVNHNPEEKREPKQTKRPGEQEEQEEHTDPAPTESSSGAKRRFALPWHLNLRQGKGSGPSTDLVRRAYIGASAAPSTISSSCGRAVATTYGVSPTPSVALNRPCWIMKRDDDSEWLNINSTTLISY